MPSTRFVCRPARVVAGLLALATATAADDAYMLRSETPWSYSWEERLAATNDDRSMPGFGSWVMPVAPGLWGSSGVMARGSSAAHPTQVPGAQPVWRGGQLDGYAELSAAYGSCFVHLQPRVLLAMDGQTPRTPAPDPRQAWTGSEGELRYPSGFVVPQGSVGVSGFGHTLALSNEPFRWGDGIFGGVVFGLAWRGFPHISLSTSLPVALVEGSDTDDGLSTGPYLGYELIYGVLNDERPNAGSNTRILGLRTALRWSAVTLSFAKAGQFNGSNEPAMPLKEQLRLLTPRNGNDSLNAPGEPNPNRLTSVGMRVDWCHGLSSSFEYGLDDQNPKIAGQSFNSSLRWTSAAWTATIDWLDLTGDSSWRMALEWDHSESYFYNHTTYGGWSFNDEPLGHADGGNTNAIRWLLQNLGDDDDRTTIIATYRRQGWRNALTGNPNSGRLDTGASGSSSFAAVPWDRVSLDARWEAEIAAQVTLIVEGGVGWDIRRNFNPNVNGPDALVGLGLRHDW